MPIHTLHLRLEAEALTRLERLKDIWHYSTDNEVINRALLDAYRNEMKFGPVESSEFILVDRSPDDYPQI